MFDKLLSFTKDVQDLADKPALDAETIKAQFDAAPDEVRQYLNKLIDDLVSLGLGNGNFSLDPNGIMTLPKQSYAYAYRSSSLSVASGVATKIAFDGTLTDRQGEFSNNIYIPKQGGLYLIITQSQWSSAPTGDTYHYIYRNGSSSVASVVGAGVKYPNISIVFAANAGENIEFYVLQNSGGATQTLTGFNATLIKLA